MTDWLSTHQASGNTKSSTGNASSSGDWLSSRSGGQSAYRPNQLVSDIKPQQVTQQRSFVSPIPERDIVTQQQIPTFKQPPIDVGIPAVNNVFTSIFSTLGQVKKKTTNLIDDVFKEKFVSPISKEDIITPKKKTIPTRIEDKKREIFSTVNKKLGSLLFSTGFIPLQYQDPSRIKPVLKEGIEPTAGRFVGGLIDDALMTFIGVGGVSVGGAVKATKKVPIALKLLKGVKTGAVFAGFRGLISAMKEEDIELPELLTAGGLGFALGYFSPQVMFGFPKQDISKAKNILKKYGFNASEFKNAEALKSKYRKLANKLAPRTTLESVSGSAKNEEWKIVVDAYNKVTSAGVDSKWKLPDVNAWLNKLWNKQGKTDEELNQLANTTFKTFLEKIIGKGGKSMELSPKSVMNIVVDSNLENTQLGKIMLKLSVQAGQQNKNLIISELNNKITGENIGKTPEGTNIGVRIVEPTEKVDKPPSEAVEPPSEAVTKPSPLVEKKAVGEGGGVVKKPAKPKAGLGDKPIKVFRGTTSKEIGIPREGLSTSIKQDVAQRYAKARGPQGFVDELYIDQKAKIIKGSDIPNEVRASGEGSDFMGKAAIWAKKKGYDVIDARGEGMAFAEQEMRILNPDVLKQPTLPAKPKAGLGDISEGLGKIAIDNKYKFNYVHNTEKAFKITSGNQFGQKIEPAGKYMNLISGKTTKLDAKQFEYGIIEFKNPLIINSTNKTSKQWKVDLSKKYNNLTGKELSRELIKEGYDGIITLEKGNPSESIHFDRLISAKPTLPAKPVKVKPKVVSVPREQIPVGEGIEKVSRLEARVKKTLADVSPETQERLGLSTFKQMNKAENIAKASKYVTENPDKALQVLRGDIEAPKGILRNSIYVAMQNLATGDVDLARKLASISSTRLGQEISILTEIDPTSPVKIMKDIIKIREKAFSKRYKGRTPSKVRKTTVKDIKSKVKAPDKWDWSSFLKTIEC